MPSATTRPATHNGPNPPPSSRKQALRYPDAQKWEKAHNAELEKLDNVNSIQWIAEKDLPPEPNSSL